MAIEYCQFLKLTTYDMVAWAETPLHFTKKNKLVNVVAVIVMGDVNLQKSSAIICLIYQ